MSSPSFQALAHSLSALIAWELREGDAEVVNLLVKQLAAVYAARLG